VKGIYLLNNIIFKKRDNRLGYDKMYLICSVPLLSTKEKYDDLLFSVYFSYFFMAGQYPVLSSVIFKKSDSRKNRNKSIYVYLFAECRGHNKVYDLLNNSLACILTGTGGDMTLKDIFIGDKIAVNNNKFTLLKFRNLNFFVIEFLNKLGLKFLTLNNILINYKLYVIFTSIL
jgi:hypothetical protein